MVQLEKVVVVVVDGEMEMVVMMADLKLGEKCKCG